MNSNPSHQEIKDRESAISHYKKVGEKVLVTMYKAKDELEDRF